MFNFKPFPHIKHIKSFALDFEPGQFCCQHKIDGANFSIYLDLSSCDDAKFFSRNLPTNDRFFNSKDVEAILKTHVLTELGDFFKSKNYSRVQLYGELYGDGITTPIKYEAPSGWKEVYRNLPPCKHARLMQYFTCFDIKHWVGDEEVYMDPELFHKVTSEFRAASTKNMPDIFLPDDMVMYKNIESDQDVHTIVKEMCTRKQPEFRFDQDLQDFGEQLDAIKNPPIEGVVFKRCKSDERFKYVLKIMRDTGEKAKVIQNAVKVVHDDKRALVDAIKANITIHRCEKRARDECYDNWGKFAQAVIDDAIEEQLRDCEQPVDLKKYANEFLNCVKGIFPYTALKNSYVKI
jgi:hypothetical protein